MKGVHNIDDLSRVAPGVTFLRNGMSASGNYNDEDSDISIRGIDSTAGAATTGIYIDDTPIQTRHLNFGTVNPYPELFDLERVEVLKGPQGTLFGSGSEGGTLRFITPAPGTYGIFGLCARRVRPDRRRWAELRGRRGLRRPDHRWRARIPHQRFLPRGRRMGRPRELHATPGRADACNPGNFGPPCFGGSALVYTTTPTVTGTIGSPTPTGTTRRRCAPRCAGRPAEGLTIDPSIYVQTLHINDTGAYWLNISDPADNVYRSGNAQRNPSTDPWYIAAAEVNWNEPWASMHLEYLVFLAQPAFGLRLHQWIDTVFLFNQYPPVGDTSSAYFTDHQNNFTQEVRLSSTDAAVQTAVDGRGLLSARDTRTRRSSSQPDGVDTAPSGTRQPRLRAAGVQHGRQAGSGVRRG